MSKLKNVDEIISNLDKVNLVAGKNTAIQMGSDGTLKKITIEVKVDKKESTDLIDKWERYSSHLSNIVLGILEYAKTEADLNKLANRVNDLFTNINDNITNKRDSF